MTYLEAAQSAFDVQDACNLSGVLFSMADAMQAICDEQHRIGEGTKWKNEHPIVTLYLCKLTELNGYWPETAYYKAHDQVKRIINGRGAS